MCFSWKHVLSPLFYLFDPCKRRFRPWDSGCILSDEQPGEDLGRRQVFPYHSFIHSFTCSFSFQLSSIQSFLRLKSCRFFIYTLTFFESGDLKPFNLQCFHPSSHSLDWKIAGFFFIYTLTFFEGGLKPFNLQWSLMHHLEQATIIYCVWRSVLYRQKKFTSHGLYDFFPGTFLPWFFSGFVSEDPKSSGLH